MPAVDVVVVSYNSVDRLRACVEPLAREDDINVIVVDSASQDGSLNVVADLPVTPVPLTANRGFAHGCNVGARMGEAPFVLLLNPDATMDPEALRRLTATAAASPDTGAAAPRIVEPNGDLDLSLRHFPRLRSTFAQALFLHRLFPRAAWSDEVVRDNAAYERRGTPDWASGAGLLFRRDVLERLGGLDEGFFLYCEELDLCKRMRDAGFVLRYDPSVVMVHEGGASAPRSALLPVLAASRVRYASKHMRPQVALLERAGIALGALTHAAVGRGDAATRRGWLRAMGRALSPRPRPGPD